LVKYPHHLPGTFVIQLMLWIYYTYCRLQRKLNMNCHMICLNIITELMNK
jgi:hypothetical protein